MEVDRGALRLLHYWWPLVLGWSLTVVVQRATGRAANPSGVIALLSGIFAAYSMDRVLDRPDHPVERWLQRLLCGSAVAATLVCALAAWHLPIRTALLVPILGGSSVLYPWLKQFSPTKILALPIVWTWAAVALPFADGSWLGWRWILLPTAAPLVLLIAAGCLLCDLKDEDADRRDGVRSLPAVAGTAVTVRVAAALAITAGVLAFVEHRTGIAVSAALLGVATLTPAVLSTESTGPLLVDMILTLPGVLISTRLV